MHNQMAETALGLVFVGQSTITKLACDLPPANSTDGRTIVGNPVS
jgi:hypothetical protein